MKFMNHEVPSHQMNPGPGDCEVIFNGKTTLSKWLLVE